MRTVSHSQTIANAHGEDCSRLGAMIHDEEGSTSEDSNQHDSRHTVCQQMTNIQLISYKHSRFATGWIQCRFQG